MICGIFCSLTSSKHIPSLFFMTTNLWTIMYVKRGQLDWNLDRYFDCHEYQPLSHITLFRLSNLSTVKLIEIYCDSIQCCIRFSWKIKSMPKLSRPALCIYFQGYSFLRTSVDSKMTVTHTVKYRIYECVYMLNVKPIFAWT